jgi:hypothetical protein
MVELDVVAALVAGFVATLVMTAMMSMAKAARMTDMPPMPLVMGSMVNGDRRPATVMGAMAHYLVMGTVVFGLAYGLVFAGLDDHSWWIGALVGMAHGLVVGLLFMPMMPAMYPRMTSQFVGVAAPGRGSTVGNDDRGEIELLAPGVLGRNWGGMTPAGLLMGHAVYGLVVSLVYGWIA